MKFVNPLFFITLICVLIEFAVMVGMKTEPQDQEAVNWKNVKQPPFEYVRQGYLVFLTVLEDYREAWISIHGAASQDPQITLYLPDTMWKKMTTEQRVNLGYFVKNKGIRMHRDPGPHFLIPTHALYYPTALNNCRKFMTQDSWKIGILHKQTDGKFYHGAEVANGSQEPWVSNRAVELAWRN